MNEKKKRWKSGDWYAIPLPEGGYAAGLIAFQTKRGGVLIGYFYGPRYKNIPSLPECLKNKPESAIFIHRCGPLGIKMGVWHYIGRDPEWKDESWPFPVYAGESISSEPLKVFFDPKGDFITPLKIEPCSNAEAAALPEDGLAGHEYVAQRIGMMLPQ